MIENASEILQFVLSSIFFRNTDINFSQFIFIKKSILNKSDACLKKGKNITRLRTRKFRNLSTRNN